MKKGWEVWVWCGLLFLAGVTWGSVKLKSEFYVVEDVHDLFEIFSSGATVVAVILAGFSVNTWRSQIKAESDHELARRLAVSILKYKETIRMSYLDASFCIDGCASGLNEIPLELYKGWLDSASSRRERAKAEKTELLALLLESRALWGDELSDSLKVFVNSCDKFQGCVRLFKFAVDAEEAGTEKNTFAKRLIERGEQYKADGWVKGKVLEKVNKLSGFADDYIKYRLLR